MDLKFFLISIFNILAAFILITVLINCCDFKAQAKTVDCKHHKIYCHIDSLRPFLDYKFKMKLSNIIYKYSKIYKVNPRISVAILMQENRFKNQHRYEYVDFVHEDGTIEEIRGITDYGIAQLHRNTIRNYHFDIKRLYNKDLDYTIECHMKILSSKLKLCAGMKKPWACYHSKTPFYRNQYIPLVEQYLNVKSNKHK